MRWLRFLYVLLLFVWFVVKWAPLCLILHLHSGEELEIDADLARMKRIVEKI
jgi:hypothetical protein